MIQEGDIFVHSWGYDQTNIDFVVVIKVNQSGKTVLCRKVKNHQFGFQEVVPSDIKDGKGRGFGKFFLLRVRQFDDGTTYLKGSYPFIDSEDSQDAKMVGVFFKWDGKPVYETDARFGH